MKDKPKSLMSAASAKKLSLSDGSHCPCWLSQAAHHRVHLHQAAVLHRPLQVAGAVAAVAVAAPEEAGKGLLLDSFLC